MCVLCYEILAWKNGSDLFFQNKEKGQLSEVLLCALFGIWYAGFWNPRIAHKKLKLEQNPGILHAMVQALISPIRACACIYCELELSQARDACLLCWILVCTDCSFLWL
jgi:hypothetical protein